ncbi:DJ-1/PfpI family protein [Cytobacillus sp. FSL K6-0265]|uniref:DJ-1/PfpI family protein n=1 Tax=Cytobacillus sp. FSL K6-0265 TaxID=2921448 RepID=UPI0030FAE52A
MKSLVILFHAYADFEISHSLFLLRKVAKMEIVTASVDGLPVTSIGGLKTTIDVSLENLNIKDYQLILIPGGDGIDNELLNNKWLIQQIQSAFQSRIPIASICASALMLGKAGILSGERFTCLPHTYNKYQSLFESSDYTGQPIEVNNRIITAKGTAFAAFAIAALKLTGVDLTDQEWEKWRQFCMVT